MGTLLSSFEKNEIKKPYQTYVVEHGIERISIKVPLKKAATFEQQFAQSDKSKPTIIKLLSALGGSVVGDR